MSNDMAGVDSKIKECMARVFKIPAQEINEDASVRTIKEWKGQNHFRMIAALESQFRIKFEDCEVETLVNFKIIRATVAAYLQ